jgi:hypothetical protein
MRSVMRTFCRRRRDELQRPLRHRGHDQHAERRTDPAATEIPTPAPRRWVGKSSVKVGYAVVQAAVGPGSEGQTAQL